MNDGTPDERPEVNDNGVVIGVGSAVQKVYIPPKPPLPIQPPFPPKPALPFDDDDTDTAEMDLSMLGNPLAPPLPDTTTRVVKETKDSNNKSSRPTKPIGDVVKLQKDRQREQRKWHNGESEDGESFFTRHHWRDPLFRLLLSRVGDWFWVFLVHIGLGLMVIPMVLNLSSPEPTTVWIVGGILFLLWTVYLLVRMFFVWWKMWRRAKKLKRNKRDDDQEDAPPEKVRPLNPGEATSINILRGWASFLIMLGIPALAYAIWPSQWLLMFVIGALSVGSAVFREWYRWRDVTILIECTARSIKITFGQPKLWILGFLGTPIGATPVLEGSHEIQVYISLADELIFKRCGDVNIVNKLTGENAQYLDSIPNVAAVQEYMLRPRS